MSGFQFDLYMVSVESCLEFFKWSFELWSIVFPKNQDSLSTGAMSR